MSLAAAKQVTQYRALRGRARVCVVALAGAAVANHGGRLAHALALS